jgi:outer membrane receptor for monomeric catechols
MDLDLFIYHVDESEGDAGLPTISAYTRIDLRYGWRPIKRMELSILITNMIDDVHAEAGDQLKINSGVERGAMLKLTYKINN